MKNIQSTLHPLLVQYFIELNKWLALLTIIGLLLTSVTDALGILIVNAYRWDTPHEIGSFLVRQVFRVVIFYGLYAAGILALRRSFARISADLKTKLGS